jgi:hypothetical protein
MNLDRTNYCESIAIANKLDKQKLKRRNTRRTVGHRAKFVRPPILFTVILLLLSACTPQSLSVASQAVDSQTSIPVLVNNTVSPEFTPTIPSTPTVAPTLTPEPTQTPTPKPTLIPPEIPYKAEDGVAYRWDGAGWVIDETFPVIESKPGKTLVLDRFETDDNGVVGAFDKNYGVLLALNLDGIWYLIDQIPPEKLGVRVTPGTLSFANPEWSFGRVINQESARVWYQEFLEALVNLNPDYFRWFVGKFAGSSDISVNTVLSAANNNGGVLPLPDDTSIPKLILPVRGRGAHIVSHSRSRGAEIGRDINISGLGLLVNDPKQFENDFLLQVLFEVADISHVLGIGQSLEWSQTGIIILPDDTLVFVHSVPKYSDANNPSHHQYERVAILGKAETSDTDLVAAYYEGYLESLKPNREGATFLPLAPDSWGYSPYRSITNGNSTVPITLPPIFQ